MGGTRLCNARAVVLLCTLFAVSIPSSCAKSAVAPSAVHLSSSGADDDIGKMTDDGEFAAFEFFAPWCPHCQNFGPTWETVAAYFNKGEHAVGGERPNPHVTVFSVDCVAEREMCHSFHIRGYPTILFGTLAQFKAEKEKENAGGLMKLGLRTAADVLDAIGKETGGKYTMTEETKTAETKAAEKAKAKGTENAVPPADADGDSKDSKNQSHHADLHDIAIATVRAWHEMTSPNLLRPEARDSFFGFLELMASSHPLRVCVDGAAFLVGKFDTLWPTEDGDMAGIRKRLGAVRICGDGLGKLLENNVNTVNKRKKKVIDEISDPDFSIRETPWRSCAGSEEGKRGYTCGLWMLFHSLAARAPGGNGSDDGGAVWFKAMVGWIEHFFPCDECRSHFLAMANEETGSEITMVRDAQLWLWKAHNKVNARLAEQEKNGEGVGSGDPAFPKVQWPDSKTCQNCRAPITGAGKSGETIRWDEETTQVFLTKFFHGVGAPRVAIGGDMKEETTGKRNSKRTALGVKIHKRGDDDGGFNSFGALLFAAVFFALFIASSPSRRASFANIFTEGGMRRILLLIRGGKAVK